MHEDPTFVLAPGHDPAQLEQFAKIPGASLLGRPSVRRGTGHEHARLPAIRADPYCVPELDRFLAAHETWVDAEALALLQEIREQHARAAGARRAVGGNRWGSAGTRSGRRAEAVSARRCQLPARPAARVPRRRAGARQDDRGARRAAGRRRVPGGRRMPGEPQAQLAARDRALAAWTQRAGAGRDGRRRPQGAGLWPDVWLRSNLWLRPDCGWWTVRRAQDARRLRLHPRLRCATRHHGRQLRHRRRAPG